MQYRYVAYSRSAGIVRGKIEASNPAEARSTVADQGYRPLRMEQARQLPAPEKIFPSLFKVSTAELIRVSRQMAIMMGSGSSLLRALEILRTESTNRALRTTLTDIRKTIDDGGSFSEALAKHPKVFSRLFVSIVEVGEFSGRLGPALEQMAEMLEADHEAKQKAIRTLMYPVAIIGLSLVTMGVLMTLALPPLLKVFATMGADVPLMTRMAVGGMTWIRENFLETLIAMVGFFIALKLLRRIPSVRHRIDAVMTRAPLAGPFVITGELARFSRTLAMLLSGGVSLATALPLAGSSCRNAVIKDAFQDAEESLISGQSLTTALKRHAVLPSLFIELVTIGEESNTLTRTMKESADAYQKQMERRLNGLLGMLEPLSTVMVGGVVGFMAFSMLAPIYSGLNALP